VAQSVAALITVHGLLSFLSGKTLWLSVIFFLFLRMYGFISFSEFFMFYCLSISQTVLQKVWSP